MRTQCNQCQVNCCHKALNRIPLCNRHYRLQIVLFLLSSIDPQLKSDSVQTNRFLHTKKPCTFQVQGFEQTEDLFAHCAEAVGAGSEFSMSAVYLSW